MRFFNTKNHGVRRVVAAGLAIVVAAAGVQTSDLPQFKALSRTFGAVVAAAIEDDTAATTFEGTYGAILAYDQDAVDALTDADVTDIEAFIAAYDALTDGAKALVDDKATDFDNIGELITALREKLSEFVVNAATPVINTQPVSKNVKVGETATLSVAATVTDGGNLTYQWYSNTSSSNTGGTLITGSTTSTYSAPTTAAGTKYYYVVVTNTNAAVNGTQTAEVKSNVATVTVTAADVVKDAGSAVSAPTIKSKSTSTIVVNASALTTATGQTIEYAISTSGTAAPTTSWQSNITFSGLTANTTYYVWARSAADTTHNAGTAVSTAIKTDTSTGGGGGGSSSGGSGGSSGLGGGRSSSDGSSSGGGSTGLISSTNGSSSAKPATVSDNVNATGSVNSAKVVEQIKAAAGNTASVTVKNAKFISAAAVKVIADAAAEAGKTVKIYADTTDASGKVVLRQYINPTELAAKGLGVNLGGFLSSENVTAIKAKFTKWVGKPVVVISLKQKTTFGVKTEIAAKVDLSELDTTKLYFYAYNAATNSYKKINTTGKVDKNGFLHFATTKAGAIVITDTPITK